MDKNDEHTRLLMILLRTESQVSLFPLPFPPLCGFMAGRRCHAVRRGLLFLCGCAPFACFCGLAAVAKLPLCVSCLSKQLLLCDGGVAASWLFVCWFVCFFPQDEEQIHLVRLESLAQLVSMHAKDGAAAATGAAAAAAEDEQFKVGDTNEEHTHELRSTMRRREVDVLFPARWCLRAT